jgi:hypothetical protein
MIPNKFIPPITKGKIHNGLFKLAKHTPSDILLHTNTNFILIV